MIYIIYTGIFLFFLGILFWFRKRSVSQVLMIIGIVSMSAGLGYGQIMADENPDNTDAATESAGTGSAGIFGDHYNIVTAMNPGAYSVPGVYLSNEPVTFGIKISDQTTLKKYKDISAFYSIDGGPYNEIVGMKNTETDYDNVGVGALAIGAHILKIKYILQPVFDVTKFNFGWFDRLEYEEKFAVQILDHNNPFGGNIEGGDTDILVKDLFFCKEHPTDPDCACTVFHPKPEEVCEGINFTPFNNCGATGEPSVGTKSAGSEECQGVIAGHREIVDTDGDGIPDFADTETQIQIKDKYGETKTAKIVDYSRLSAENKTKIDHQIGKTGYGGLKVINFTDSKRQEQYIAAPWIVDEDGDGVNDSITHWNGGKLGCKDDPFKEGCECVQIENSWHTMDGKIKDDYCEGATFTQFNNCGGVKVAIGSSLDDSVCEKKYIPTLQYTTSVVTARTTATDSNNVGGWQTYPIKPEETDRITITVNSPIYFRIKPVSGQDEGKLIDPVGWSKKDLKGGKVFNDWKTFGTGSEEIAIATFKPEGEGIKGRQKNYNVGLMMLGAMDEFRTILLHVVPKTSRED